MGHSITGGGDGGAMVEVATSFLARCLGAIRTQGKVLKNSNGMKKEEEKIL